MSTEEKLPPINHGGMQSSFALSTTQQQKDATNAYHVSGLKHYLPSKQSLNPGQDTYTGTIETWPAHASKSVLSAQLTKGKSTRKIRTPPKPKFLSGLEAYAKRELYLLRCEDDEPNELRLQAFREVFEYLIDDFKTYKPLLSQIKNEYERNLSCLRRKIDNLEPLKSMLVTVSAKCEQKIQEFREAEQHEIKELMQNKMELLEIIDQHRENEVSLHAQIRRLQEELGNEYKRFRNEHEMRKMLLADINELKNQQEDMKKAAAGAAVVEAKDDPVALKIALKVAREDLTRCLTDLNILRADYNDVVPRRDYDSVKADHDMLVIETKNVKTEYAKLHSEHQTLLQVHEELLTNRDEIYTELTELKRSATPRPSWADCHEVLPIELGLWQKMIKGKPSKEVLSMFFEEIRKGGGGGGSVFTGKGVTDDIPKYLRFEGPVKNRYMTKAELSTLMKDLWAEKAKSDGERGSKQEMTEFVYDYFYKNFNGSAEMIAEFSYSMLDTLEKHQEELNMSILYDVLNGKANEEFYYRHMEVIKTLMTNLQKFDPDSTGIVPPADFSKALKTAYPMKNEHQIKSLKGACYEELGESKESAFLKYMDLFTEDEEGHTGPFLNLLRKQENKEIKEYVKDVGVQLNRSDPVGVLMLREAFMMADPHINQPQMLQHLRMAFNCSIEQLDDAEPIKLETLLAFLPKSGVYRTGKS